MADNSGAEKTSSPLHEHERHRKERLFWWTIFWRTVDRWTVFGWAVNAVLTIALVGVIWLLSSDWFVALVSGAGVQVALALWKVPQWQVGRAKDVRPQKRFDCENEARKTLATIIGGLLLFAGGFLTWRNIKVAQESASTSEEALRVSREGQIADRFSKAIEQLGARDTQGNNKPEVRVGGIYALEGIANESEGLHWPIMEELCTYVRENGPLKPQESTQENQTPHSHLAADIQAILTVLGRRDTQTVLGRKVAKYERESQVLDLRGTDLSRANLRGAYLSKANLNGPNLSGANLEVADLSETNLSGAILGGADLRGANLSRTNLLRADLSGADLREANLRGADLRRANLRGTSLARADLSGADLTDALYLTQGQIDAAEGDSYTRLPDNLHMPENSKR